MGDRLRARGRDLLTDAGEAFIRAETRLLPVPSLPGIRLYQATDATALWQRTADQLDAAGAPLPFWAFAWAGGRGLARHVLDHPGLVSGRRVLDFAAGSGLVGIAAALAGAARVEAVDIDPLAIAAIRLNAAANGVTIAGSTAATGAVEADLVLCGDIFYDRAMTASVLPWLRSLAGGGIEVVVGDPGRRYCPAEGVIVSATVTVPVETALEDGEAKEVRILSLLP